MINLIIPRLEDWCRFFFLAMLACIENGEIDEAAISLAVFFDYVPFMKAKKAKDFS